MLYNKTSLLVTAQLLQGSSGARAKIWSNFTTKQAYLLQQSYSQTLVELEPTFGHVIQQDKPNTTEQPLPDFSRARAKIWSINTQDKAYTTTQLMPHSSTVELEPKFGQILQQDKRTYYSIATPRH